MMKIRVPILGILLLLCSCASGQVRSYKLEVEKEYPHDTGSYTQGLFFHDGTLYETTGQYGDSRILAVDLETGEARVSKKLSSKYFGEGSVIMGDSMYILTWQNKVAFRYDAASLTWKSTISYPREGWGLTTDGTKLYASDGTSNLYVLDKDLKVRSRIPVTLEGRPLRFLNELEWIDGKIWANVYTTDMIVIIDPSSGKVEAKIDCSGLLPDSLRGSGTDVLNGIAADRDGNVYVTGKNWPRLYRIKLVRTR